MQGVQGIQKSGRTRLAAYEEYSILGRCPECREGLVYAGDERTELTCSYCGIVVSRAEYTREDGSTAPSVSKSEPLGSYIVADTESASSLKGPAFGWAKLMPNIVGRGGPMPTCSMLTNRIAERLSLPKSIAQAADITARRLLPHREAYEATIPSISAYSLLFACRSAAIVHISHREILKAYTDGGYRVRKSDLLKLGLESGMHLPHPSKDDFVRAAIGRLQSSERIAERLRKSEADPEGVLHDPLRACEGARGLGSGAERLQPKDRRGRVGLPGVLGNAAQDLHAERGGGNTRDQGVHRTRVLLPEAERGVRDSRRTAGSAR